MYRSNTVSFEPVEIAVKLSELQAYVFCVRNAASESRVSQGASHSSGFFRCVSTISVNASWCFYLAALCFVLDDVEVISNYKLFDCKLSVGKKYILFTFIFISLFLLLISTAINFQAINILSEILSRKLFNHKMNQNFFSSNKNIPVSKK